MSGQAEAHYTCPDCGSIDLAIRGEGIKDSEGKSLARATCPNCAWDGNLSDTIGFATTETVWTVERIAEVLLRVSTKHAAGPIIQVLEFSGLIPKHMDEAPPPEQNQGRNWSDEKLKQHNELAQIIRDRVARRVFESFVTAAFEEAAETNKMYCIEMDMPLHELLKGESPNPAETGTLRKPAKKFGGDVVNIEDAKKKK